MNELQTQNKAALIGEFEKRMQMAEVMAKSGLLPQSMNTKEKVFVALQWGEHFTTSVLYRFWCF